MGNKMDGAGADVGQQCGRRERMNGMTIEAREGEVAQ